jgi:hypothetical protein
VSAPYEFSARPIALETAFFGYWHKSTIGTKPHGLQPSRIRGARSRAQVLCLASNVEKLGSGEAWCEAKLHTFFVAFDTQDFKRTEAAPFFDESANLSFGRPAKNIRTTQS